MGIYVTLDLLTDHPATESTSRTVEADSLHQLGNRYHRAAAVVAKLEGDGWSILSFAILVCARHPSVRTLAQARQRLSSLGIDLKDVEINVTPRPRDRQAARKSFSHHRRSGSQRGK